MANKFTKDFVTARKVSVPLMGIETADAAQTMRTIIDLLKDEEVDEEKDNKVNRVKVNGAAMSWDSASGFKARNNEAKQALQDALGEVKPDSVTSPIKALGFAAKFPKHSVLFMLNGHRFISSSGAAEAAVGQAIWNLRDPNKANGRTLVILSPAIVLPDEIKHDILILEETLPTKAEIIDIIKRLCKNVTNAKGELSTPLDEKTTDKAAEILKGLAPFDTEQSTAMSLSRNEEENKLVLDMKQLWDRKRRAVENTVGLEIYTGEETFADMIGVTAFKEFLTEIITGNDAPTVLVFLDEIEKMFAGLEGDTSGTSQGQHGEFLRWTQDNKILAAMLVGHPGCTKSFSVKCAGGQFKLPVVMLNISALKGGLVGQTEAQTRAAFRTISAIGKPLILATSNSLKILPPELKRRFKLGTWFFDLPEEAQRDATLALYLKKYNIQPPTKKLILDGWTPSEIETMVEMAWRRKISLEKAQKQVVPIFKSDPSKIEELRMTAHMRFNNASAPGAYIHTKMQVVEEAAEAIRVFNLPKSSVGEA